VAVLRGGHFFCLVRRTTAIVPRRESLTQMTWAKRSSAYRPVMLTDFFYVNHLIDLLPGSTDTLQGLPAMHFGNREDRTLLAVLYWPPRIAFARRPRFDRISGPSLENSTAVPLAAKLRFVRTSRSSRRPWLFCFFPLRAFADTVSEYLTNVWNSLRLRTRGHSFREIECSLKPLIDRCL
jgi:hypothetical protein